MKKFRLFNWVMLIFIGISASSCFDILEEYTFNADGSGKARFTIDVSQMMDLMASFSEMDSTGEASQSMEEMFTENSTYQALKNIPGITNVVDLNSKEDQVIGYSYEFESLEALNNALAIDGGESQLMGMGMDMSADNARENYFEQKGKKLTRVFNMAKSDDEEKSEEDAQYEEMAKMMFADANYTIKYSFENGVKKVKKNENAVISPDKKAVTIEVPLLDLLEEKGNLGAQIQLK